MKEDTVTLESLLKKGEFICEVDFVPGDIKIGDPLGRNKNQTIETALKNWIAAHGEKGKAYLAVTITSDLYQFRARQVMEAELLKKL